MKIVGGNKIYLASGSSPRQKLLNEAGIKFSVIPHRSRESVEDGLSIQDRVVAIAQDKMTCVDMTSIPKTIPAVILTADTMVEVNGNVLGKPKDIADARRMIGIIRQHDALVVTGCCLEQRKWNGKIWETEQKISWFTTAVCSYIIPPELVDGYLKNVPEALQACGGCIIEGYGHQFLHRISGSYSTVLGLPMAELRENLLKIRNIRRSTSSS